MLDDSTPRRMNHATCGSSLLCLRTSAMVLVLWMVVTATAQKGETTRTTTCSLDSMTGNDPQQDPNLHAFSFDVGNGPQSTLIYVEPDVATFYPPRDHPEHDDAKDKQRPYSPSFTGKFINLSNVTTALAWESQRTGQRRIMAYLQPWQATTLGTTDNHVFLFLSVDQGADAQVVLTRVQITEYPAAWYAYDPYQIRQNPTAPAFLSPPEATMYTHWRQTALYYKAYVRETTRAYLANFLRPPPIHFMWPAAYFGQEHWTLTKELQFTTLPDVVDKVSTTTTTQRRHNTEADDSSIVLVEYRGTKEDNENSDNANVSAYLNLTLRVISVAPRVLEIPNFASPTEIMHLTQLADQVGFTDYQSRHEMALERETSLVLDAIYRRVADLLRVDEALLRNRQPTERPDIAGSFPLTETLRIMKFTAGQSYPEHVDFGNMDRITQPNQPNRFSTLMIYLRTPTQGGATTFPRFASAHTSKELDVFPDAGNAVLLYNQLPDGNFDDCALYGIKTIEEGELIVAYLFLWDPVLVE